MEFERAALVIILTLLIVGLFNLSLYLAFRRDQASGGMVEMFRRASQRAKDPWKDEDNDLDELSRRVKALRQADAESGDKSEPPAAQPPNP